MALNLGTLNVNFTASTRDFDRGLRKVKRSIETLGDDTGELANRVGRVEKKMKSAGGAADRTSRSMSNFMKNVKALANKLRVLAFVGGGIVAILVSLRQEMAGLAVAAGAVVTAIMLEPVRQQLRATADSAEQVTQRMDELMRVADDAGTRLTAIGAGAADVVSAITATGGSMAQATDIVEGFSENMRGLGIASEDVQSKLEELSEISKTGTITMDELRDSVSFTANPARTLANAFDMSVTQIRNMINEGKTLNANVLVQLGQHLEDTSQKTTTLASQFNRLINTITGMLDATQIADAVEDLMGQLNEALQGARVQVFFNQFSRAIEDFIRNTIPAFTQSVVNNWDTIVVTIKAALGVLIGSAVGGAPGGLIGGLIGGFEKTAATMGIVGDAVSVLADNFTTTASIIAGAFVGRALTSMVSKMLAATSVVRALTTALGGVAAVLGGVAGMAAGGIVAGLTLYARNATESMRKTKALTEAVNSLGGALDTLSKKKLKDMEASLIRNQSKLEGRALKLQQRMQNLQGQTKTARGGSKGADVQLERLQKRLDAVRERADEARKSLDRVQDALSSDDENGSTATGDGNSPFNLMTEKGAGGARRMDRMNAALGEYVHNIDRAAENTGVASREFDDFIDNIDRMETAAQGIGDAFADSFVRAIVEGEKLSNVLESLGKDIARILLRQSIAKPAAAMIGNALSGMFTGTQSTTAAQGFVQSGGGRYAKGGIANKPSVFGEAGPEAAVPLPDGRSIPVDMRGSGTQVVINDMRGSDAPEVETSERRGPDGKRMLEIAIRDSVSGQLQRGEHDGAMRKRFGVKPTTRGR